MAKPKACADDLHVGIIMDGNGRWAQARGLPRTEGHREGLKAAKRIVAAAEACGVKWLSLYTFSTENWKRAETEVSFLMGLIRGHLRAEFNFYRDLGVRVVHSGDSGGLPAEVRAEIESVVADTAAFDRMTVNLAINYGGRDEIVRAARKAVRDGVEITDASLANRLDMPDLPDLDLVIRTGGEMRISNFLLWQSAYAELFFSPRLWPDWGEADLEEALQSYSCRDRRFGGAK